MLLVSFRVLTSTRDQQEGVKAFFEKRNPSFKATLEDDAPPNFPWWTEIDTGRRGKAARSKIWGSNCRLIMKGFITFAGCDFHLIVDN